MFSLDDVCRFAGVFGLILMTFLVYFEGLNLMYINYFGH